MATELCCPLVVSRASGRSLVFAAAPAKEIGLTPRLALLQAQWGGLCQALFHELAATAPHELAQLGRHGEIREARLTYAAEILGSDVQDGAIVIPALLRALKHPSHIVREGAVLGLSYHVTDRVRVALERVAQEDPSPGVRAAATEALED